MQRGAVAGVYRQIPYEILGFRELGLPPVVELLCDKPRGLVLVTGPTGSGKSTTLAAMLDKINRETQLHIITIEDPIEFLHSAQEVHRQPARAARRHALVPERAASPSSARTPTSCSSAKCATSRRSSPRCASRRRAT